MVSAELVSQKARELEVLHMEVSAKTGHNVNELFKSISMNLTGNEPSQIGIQSGVTGQDGAAREENIRLEEGEMAEKKAVKKCC